jgi:hypothetical protein
MQIHAISPIEDATHNAAQRHKRHGIILYDLARTLKRGLIRPSRRLKHTEKGPIPDCKNLGDLLMKSCSYQEPKHADIFGKPEFFIGEA